MQFLLLISEPRGQRKLRTAAEGSAAYDEMVQFGARLQARGILLGAESLQADESAVRVQRRGGDIRTLDGPFSEAKEMIGGFFLIDCGTIAEAVAIAAECPAAQWATVEVRATGPCFT